MKKFSLLTSVPLFALTVLSFLGFTTPADAGTLTFTLSKNAATQYANVSSGAGVWMYTYTVRGKVSDLAIDIKNHVPGAADFCPGGHFNQRQPTSGTHNTDLPIPAAVPQACGNTWFDPDPALGIVLYLQTGDSKAAVDVTVTYPDP